jgi:thioesterase domain-containing protein/acyl carrier protein
VPGELYVAGLGLARGYLRRPDLTAEKFVPDPFRAEPGARMYRTADLVRHLPDGDIDFLGRLDHQVKVRGLRIELGEIETVLGEHPGVREVVVLAREDRPGDKRLVAYLTLAGEPGPTSEDLQSFLAERLPAYMVPAAFLYLASFPLSANGKVDRKALPAPEWAPQEAYVAPRGEVEEALAAIWAAVLGVEQVGAEDNFFSLGGNSIAGAILIARLQEKLGEVVHVIALFDHPTVAELAAYLTREHAGAVARLWGEPGAAAHPALPGCLVGLQRGGAGRPLFLVHPAFGDVQFYRHLAQALDPERPVYGLQASGLYGASAPLSRVEEMAALYCTALRAVQPRGPYLLAGSSLGGVIAYEVAQQLGEVGEEVSFLGLIDSWVFDPSLPKVGREEAELTILAYLNGEGNVSQRGFERLCEVFLLNQEAFSAYRPRPYMGRLFYFRAAASRPGARPEAAWDELCGGRAEVHTVPGDHLSALFPPHVEILGARMRGAIEISEELHFPALLGVDDRGQGF